MSEDALATCCTAICGFFCVCCTSGFGGWTNTTAYGADGCCNSRGCCGSCCSRSFDGDAWDEQARKDMAKTRDPNAQVNSIQPTPTANMATNEDTPAPTKSDAIMN